MKFKIILQIYLKRPPLCRLNYFAIIFLLTLVCVRLTTLNLYGHFNENKRKAEKTRICNDVAIDVAISAPVENCKAQKYSFKNLQILIAVRKLLYKVLSIKCQIFERST